MLVIGAPVKVGAQIDNLSVLTLCRDNIPWAKTKAPHVLQRSIIRLVLVGQSVAIVLQKKLISAYDLNDSLVKDLEENNYIAKYIEKPILINSLIELVADTIS
jgi:hypothetical protein